MDCGRAETQVEHQANADQDESDALELAQRTRQLVEGHLPDEGHRE